MTDTVANLHRKINTAKDLQSVVRTMKAMAASNIGQYQNSVRALVDYTRTVELGLAACLREQSAPNVAMEEAKTVNKVFAAIVFGSDQGLVGQFNNVVSDYVISSLAELSGEAHIWAVGERVHARLADAGLPMLALFTLPHSVKAIAPFVGQMQIEMEKHQSQCHYSELYIFHNRPQNGSFYEPIKHRLLPLDWQWQQRLRKMPWPSKNLPQVLCAGTATLTSLIREYLFISLFRACAESLASENASRLVAMERADKNIQELLENLHVSYHQLRQSLIDEELFDVIAGYESLTS